MPPGATASPTPSSSTPCTRTWAPTRRPGPIARWPRPSRPSSGTAPVPAWASSPITGSTPPSPSTPTKAITYARQAGEAALAALAPDDAVRYFSQALELATHSIESTRTGALLSCSAWVSAQRQAGVPGFRETLLDAAPGPGSRCHRSARGQRWRTTGDGYLQVGVDTDKVAVLEAALEVAARRRQPAAGPPARHLVYGAQLRTSGAPGVAGRRGPGHGAASRRSHGADQGRKRLL